MMDGRGRGPGGQRAGHHAPGLRARPVEQHADLHVRHAVEVEHDVAASRSMQPECRQSQTSSRSPPEREESSPCRVTATTAIRSARPTHLVVHPAIIALTPRARAAARASAITRARARRKASDESLGFQESDQGVREVS